MKLLALIAALSLVSCSCSTAPVKVEGPAEVLKVEETKKSELTTIAVPKGSIPHIKISGSITEEMATAFVGAMEVLNEASIKHILIEIDTTGGSVDAGFKIAKAIEESDVAVTCVVDGAAISMGFYILQACPIRIMTDRSVLMVHEPSIDTIIRGNSIEWAKEGKRLSRVLEVLTDAMNHHLCRRLDMSFKDFTKRIHGDEWWMSADEAAKVKAVDLVVESVAQVKVGLSRISKKK